MAVLLVSISGFELCHSQRIFSSASFNQLMIANYLCQYFVSSVVFIHENWGLHFQFYLSRTKATIYYFSLGPEKFAQCPIRLLRNLMENVLWFKKVYREPELQFLRAGILEIGA